MKRVVLLIALVVLVVILAGSSATAVPDTDFSIADSNIADDEIPTSQTEAGNSSASATIGITMYAVDDASSSDTDTATVTLRARTIGVD